MRTVENMLQAAQKLDIQYLIELSFIETAGTFLEKQKEQLMAGERNDGKMIFNVKTGSNQYSPAYAKKKGKSSPIDLRDKGEWQGGLFVDVREQELYIASTDSKDAILNENYGEEILGLNQNKRTEYAPILAGAFVRLATNKLNNR